VLLLDIPDPEMLARFPVARCIGMAGSSRGRSPEWMEVKLPKAFAALAALKAPILHYKVCSTLDSSPTIGSIGRAIDLGVRHVPGRWSPSIIGAPRLRRYQVFGKFFAAVGGIGYRLDRHPTMSRHPVTPMGEADLRRHLSDQTGRRIELIDMLQLRQGTAAERSAELMGDDIPVSGCAGRGNARGSRPGGLGGTRFRPFQRVVPGSSIRAGRLLARTGAAAH
jgi:uncharacterized protein YgbK (DUF1537 family)